MIEKIWDIKMGQNRIEYDDDKIEQGRVGQKRIGLDRIGQNGSVKIGQNWIEWNVISDYLE